MALGVTEVRWLHYVVAPEVEHIWWWHQRLNTLGGGTELLPPLMVVAHCLLLGWPPTLLGWWPSRCLLVGLERLGAELATPPISCAVVKWYILYAWEHLISFEDCASGGRKSVKGLVS